ncbi:MAG: GTPase HflX [Pseudomonadota bacterium]
MQIHGNTLGLKSSHLRQLNRLLRRRVDAKEVIGWELAKQLASISREIHRQVGVLIDRSGNLDSIYVGEARSLHLPKDLKIRRGNSRLVGYRLIRTGLDGQGLGRADTTELTMHRLDLVAAIEADESGFPGQIAISHISPEPEQKNSTRTIPSMKAADLDFNFQEFIKTLEEELRQTTERVKTVRKGNRAILVALALSGARRLEEDLAETRELARTAGLEIVDTITQRRDKPDPKFCVGEGKLEDLSLRTIQHGADILIFQENLSPNQARHLFDRTELKIIDRTQLILDIFAQRAKSHDGKLQVELAQLRYSLPRLRERESMLSRLVGGIGGRGPGETTLEVHRRRADDRINRLEKEIEGISTMRAANRRLRSRKAVPIVSIVGYTNAGKSTLLNTLTGATALVEDKLFATLDPFSKRMRFPRDRELIVTDTVGFIRKLPKDLIAAFRATLEEIGQANVLLHVVDVSNENYEDHIKVVNEILEELGHQEIPQILVLNKMDRIGPGAERIAQSLNGVAISALSAETTRPLLARLESALWKSGTHD